MKFYHNTLLILLAIVLLAGCATPKGTLLLIRGIMYLI